MDNIVGLSNNLDTWIGGFEYTHTKNYSYKEVQELWYGKC